MDYAVVGGDARFAYLTRLLCACGHDARAVNGADCGVPGVPAAGEDELAQTRNVIMNWPCPEGEQILGRLTPGVRVFFCGPGTPPEDRKGLKFSDLWRDERLLADNAYLTAEGAVCAAMNAGVSSLNECSCLVIGWGRIGRALTEILVGLNARVAVASRSEKGRNGAIGRGAEGVSTYDPENALKGRQIIFCTSPERVLGEEELRYAGKDAMIIDLSSAPFGVDLDAAGKLNLRAWREPKLPGRYCPFSAARALLRAVFRAERTAGI